VAQQSPQSSTTPDAGAWAAWSAALADAVQGLAERASLTVTGPTGSARPVRRRKARLGGFIPARHEVVTPWVRLVRVEDFLRGHCIGAELIGAHFPLSPDEDAALLALGWHHPTPMDGEDYLRFWPDDVPSGPFLPRAEAERAAAMVAATFRDVLAVGATDLPTLT
jgi:type III secretion system-like peptide-binding chaperone